MSKERSFQIPEGFDLLENLEVADERKFATVDVRKDKALNLRQNALEVTDMGEWERLKIEYVDSSAFVDSVLWYLDDVLVIEPFEVRQLIIEALRELADSNG
jgi:predicted DNA-binding transcriptional regulator YafY